MQRRWFAAKLFFVFFFSFVLSFQNLVWAASALGCDSANDICANSTPIATYFATDSSLRHAAGIQTGTTGWQSDTSRPQDAGKYLTYGPYTEALPAGSYTARFVLLVDNNSASDDIIATVDVNDANSNQVLASENLSRREFSPAYQATSFDLPFDAPANAKLEFRVKFGCCSYLQHVQTQILARNRYVSLYLANGGQLQHAAGYASGSRWTTDTSHPQDVGKFLTYGPYVSLPQGQYLAQFTLAVDNTTADNNLVATIDVNNATAQSELASLDLHRKAFAGPYQPTTFELLFTAAPGEILEFRVVYRGATYLQHLKTVVRAAPNIPSPNSGLSKILFSVDQGVGNGIVVNEDTVSVQAIASAVAPLQQSGKYDVFAIVNPMTANKSNVYSILDTLVSLNFPFMLDVYTSDATSLGNCDAGMSNPSGYTSLTIPLSDLAYYRARYGSFFAGIRIFEMVAQDNYYTGSYPSFPSDRTCWMSNIPYKPNYALFNPSYVQSILQFAQSQGLFVELSDWDWHFVKGQTPGSLPYNRSLLYEQDIANAIAAVGGASANVYLTFANNNAAPSNAFWNSTTNSADWSAAANSDWPTWVPGLSSITAPLNFAPRIGLSDQSWMCSDEISCPAGNVVTWAWGALQSGAQLIQFEPTYYLFNLPGPLTFWPVNYLDPTYTPAYPASTRGQPNSTFQQLKNLLLCPPSVCND